MVCFDFVGQPVATSFIGADDCTNGDVGDDDDEEEEDDDDDDVPRPLGGTDVKTISWLLNDDDIDASDDVKGNDDVHCDGDDDSRDGVVDDDDEEDGPRVSDKMS